MDNPAERGSQGTAMLIGVAAALGAMAVAGAAWAGYCYYIMGRIPYGLIFLPVFAGGGSGLILKLGRKYLAKRIGLIAIAGTIAGCISGDFAWIMMSTTKPLSVLLGTELGMTLRTLFWYDKLLFYGITSYIAYAISNPSRGVVSD
jgi:hypothetical protein